MTIGIFERFFVATLFGASLVAACSASGTSGETHFLKCTVTADCASLGPSYACVDRVCIATGGTGNGGAGGGTHVSGGGAGRGGAGGDSGDAGALDGAADASASGGSSGSSGSTGARDAGPDALGPDGSALDATSRACGLPQNPLARPGSAYWAKMAAVDQLTGVDPSGIAVDPDGNVVIGGEFYGRFDLSATVVGGPETLQAASVTYDAFAAKLDAKGGFLWQKRFGDAAIQSVLALAVDAAGDVYLAGTSAGTMIIPGVDASHTGTLTSPGTGQSAFVVKLDPDGNHLWSRRWGGPSGVGAVIGMALDGNGHIALAGVLDSTLLDFDPAHPLVAQGRDAFVAELTTDGDVVWAHRYGDGSDQQAWMPAFDSAGNVYAVGDFRGSIDFVEADDGGAHAFDAEGTLRAFLVKLDPGGHHLFSREFGNPRHPNPAADTAQATHVAVNHRDEVLVTGLFMGDVDFSSDDEAGTHVLTSAGEQDGFLAELASDGTLRFGQRYGDADTQQLGPVAVGADDSIYLGGSFSGSIDFSDTGAGKLTSNGPSDAFVAHLDRDGKYLSATSYGDDQSQGILSLGLDPCTSDPIVGGFARGTITVPNADDGGTESITTNAGSAPTESSMWFARLSP